MGLAWLSRWGCSPLLGLLGRFGPEAVWEATRTKLLRWGLSPAAVQRFEDRRRQFCPSVAEHQLEESRLSFLPYGSAFFSTGLTHLSYPPAGLFVRGKLELLESLSRRPCMAVVGTRKASAYGSRQAETFACALARRGAVVVSGMAFGIDAVAHRAALDAGGVSVAVLGCGADVVYPRRHADLHRRLSHAGLVVSELPPGCPPARWTFPHRNRLLAALSGAVLVVEGSKTSGAMQTAGWSLELGKPVFVVPGPVMVERHEGCNALIYDGATPALCPEGLVEDFLAATGMETGEQASLALPDGAEVSNRDQSSMRPDESLLELLAAGPHSVDELARLTGWPVRLVVVHLAGLELQGLVARGGPGLFIRAP